MTAQPIGGGGSASPPPWHANSRACHRSYKLAGLRAGLIALVLLAVLALVVLL